MKVIYSILLLIVALGISCKSSSQNSSESLILTYAEDYFEGKDYVMVKNNDYALFYTALMDDPLEVDHLVRYYVYSIKTDDVIFEGKLTHGGYVKWINDDKIEIYAVPGIPQGDKTPLDYTTIYNVKTKESRKKSEDLIK